MAKIKRVWAIRKTKTTADKPPSSTKFLSLLTSSCVQRKYLPPTLSKDKSTEHNQLSTASI